jgi:hypothetical protein
MRTIDVSWMRVADGVQEVQRLEAELRARWSPAIAEARRRTFERRTSMACAVAAIALATVGLFGATMGSAAVVVGAALAALACAAPLVASRRPWRRSGAEEEAALPIPRLAGVVLRFSTTKSPVSLDILEAWWAEIGRVARASSGYDPAAQRAGEEGESLLIAELSRRLAHDHVAMRGVLVRRRLDADVVVVGSTGIWVFEVKHWSGTIMCIDGRWQRTKAYRGPGGRLVEKVTPFKWPPDEQWALERGAVEQTVRRRLNGVGDVGALIGGGIAFTHPNARLMIDGSSNAPYGNLLWWSSTASEAPPRPGLAAAKTFEIVDALLAWHRRQSDDAAGQGRCAVELARDLARQAAARADTYCGGRSP